MDKPPAIQKPRLTFGQRSDIGMVRGNNQDSALSIVFADDSYDTLVDFGIFIVADGMGGHRDGERASRLITRLVSRQAMNLLHDILLTNERVLDDTGLLDKLNEAVRQGRTEVNAEVPHGDTTCTLTVIVNNKIYIAHVGDCRAYFLSEKRMMCLTEDIPLVRYLGRQDDIDWKHPEVRDYGIDLSYIPPVNTYEYPLVSDSYLRIYYYAAMVYGIWLNQLRS
jgi:PPM family protein phosphatase